MLWKKVLQQTLLSSQFYSLNTNEILFIKTTAALPSFCIYFFALLISLTESVRLIGIHIQPTELLDIPRDPA